LKKEKLADIKNETATTRRCLMLKKEKLAGIKSG
jgi:hypothetical protein